MTSPTTEAAPATPDPADSPDVSFAQAVNDALDTALGSDPTVVLLGEDIQDPKGGAFGQMKGLSTKYGLERVRPTPISEIAILGAAVGSAIAGLRPVAEIMLMNFLAVCLDQLTNHAAKLRFMSGGQTNVPMTVRTPTGAGFGFGAQHSDMLEAWLVHTPGLKVIVPSCPADAKGLLLSAIFDDDPCVLVENFYLYYSSKGPVPPGDVRVPLGQASVLRSGSDVTVLTYGRQVHDCLKAAETMEQEGISIEVIDLRTLVPLDHETVLESAARTRRAIVVHEAVRRNGFGAELAAMLSEELFGELEAPVLRVTAKNTPVPFAPQLETEYLLDATDVENAVRCSLGLKKD